MKYPKIYTFDEMNEHLLKKAIRNEIGKRWKSCLFMAPYTETDEHFWGEEIDALADMLLEIDRA